MTEFKSFESMMRELETHQKTKKYRYYEKHKYALLRKWKKVQRIPREVRFWTDKRRYGWSEEDLWGLDHFYAKLFVDTLTVFRDYQHGYPNGLTPESWRAILDEMIEGFQYFLDHDFSYDREIEEEVDKKLKRSFKLMSKYFRNLWD